MGAREFLSRLTASAASATLGATPVRAQICDAMLHECSIVTPVQLIWGNRDVYGGPEIGERAAALLPRARLELIEGGHAPFLDEPERCAELIRQATMGPRSRSPMASDATGAARA